MTTGDVHAHRESPAMKRPRERGSRVRAACHRPGNSMGRARGIGPAVVAASLTVLVASVITPLQGLTIEAEYLPKNVTSR
jgi:hypothetical protein